MVLRESIIERALTVSRISLSLTGIRFQFVRMLPRGSNTHSRFYGSTGQLQNDLHGMTLIGRMATILACRIRLRMSSPSHRWMYRSFQ